MTSGTVLAFWAVSALFVMLPGADWAYAITAGIRHRTIVPAISGLLAGHVLATLVVAAGVAALIARVPTILAGLTLCGAAYLVWLGAGTVRRPPAPQDGSTEAPESWSRRAFTGFGISGLNPKVLLLFLALLPQFTNPAGAWPVAAQILLLGLVHVTTCALVYTGVGTGARRVLATRPAAAHLVSRASGLAMILIGVLLMVEQVR